ncbi:hypothetical protein EON77_06915 [bacterium]|nr:MAG: hypothetical protein EON77_06915 [bacterium]
MLPILPLLLILLFPGVATHGTRIEASPVAGAAYERRLVAALVETVRQEAEREALAASITPQVVRPRIAPVETRAPQTAIRRADRVRDGPVA